MSTGASLVERLSSDLTSRLKIEDPLVATLVRKSLNWAVILLVVAAVWLVGANLVFTRLIYAPRAVAPAADLVLEAASDEIRDVVRFANSQEPLAAEAKPGDTYPAEIDVMPLLITGNPFAATVVAKAPDLGALIRSRQAAAPKPGPEPAPEPQVAISIRGIVNRGATTLAILSSGETSGAVRAGDSFMDWQVLAVGRDQVVLEKNGKIRTIAWEGSK